jgi:hypothetical protein
MAICASGINPKGLIGSDAGFGKPNIGIEGLAILHEQDIGAAGSENKLLCTLLRPAF